MSVSLATEPELVSKLAAIELVLMDVDGTLVTGPDDTLQAVITQLFRLKAHGIRFSVATGRTLFGARSVLNLLEQVRAKLPPVIAYNGAVVAVPGPNAVIDRTVIAQSELAKTLRICKRYGLQLLVYACDTGIDLSAKEQVFSPNRALVRRPEFNGMPVRLLNWHELENLDGVVSLLGATPSRDIRLAAQELQGTLAGTVRVTTSGKTFVEISANATTKLTGMLRLASLLHLEPKAILAVGDNFNDIEMLKGAGVGVAVANAPDAVKKASHLVCSGERSAGVVEILRILLDAQRIHRLEQRMTLR
jgi:Cof subfamily protein (haloacid dehalogenase superfamily)